jgi:hypothetical protein
MRTSLIVIHILLGSLMVAGCMTVRQEDLASWEGAPVSALNAQPFFLTRPMVRTVTADGTEIRNYVNGASVGGLFRRWKCISWRR